MNFAVNFYRNNKFIKQTLLYNVADYSGAKDRAIRLQSEIIEDTARPNTGRITMSAITQVGE